MEAIKYSIRISPENLSGDIFNVCYPSGSTHSSGCTYSYSGLSYVLSGGTGGASLLTDLSFPILLTETAVDIGYYSIFDGNLLQADVVKNFVFSANTTQPNRWYLYNTSEQVVKNYLIDSTFQVDWGDDTPIQNVTTFSPNYISHHYVSSGTYTITLTQINPWGTNIVKKTVVVPYTNTTILNPNGTAYFVSNTGAWSATPISYDYIYLYDSENNIPYHLSSNYVTTPFTITGYTNSRLNELKLYGPNKFALNTVVKDGNGQFFGVVSAMTSTFTGYTIQDVQYFDFSNGVTVYVAKSSGYIPEWLLAEPIVKDESLINIVYTPEVQSDIFIERGKNSALERIQRLGEVDNIGDLASYGYGFFNFVSQENML